MIIDMQAKIQTLQEAIATHLFDGATVAMEGFTHLIPFAAGHEIIRQGFKNLELVRMTPDMIYDQLIGAGCVRKLRFSWGGNPGVGSLYRLREAIEKGYPQPLEVDEHSHAAMAAAYAAGASGMPCAIFKGYYGADLEKVNPSIKTLSCPFTGERLVAVPAIRPDVTIIHAQKASKKGDVSLEGIVGVQKEAVLAAKAAIVTVEEIVDELQPTSPNAVILPSWTVSAVVHAPGGAKPSYAHGYYSRDNKAYIAWEAISKDREKFNEWLQDLKSTDYAV